MELNDIKKLLTTAEIAENFNVETTNVLEACKKKRLNENEAVETAVGWLITPEGAARLWNKRESIVDVMEQKLKGKKWVRSMVLKYAEKAVLDGLGTERKRKCILSIYKKKHLSIQFKDKTLIVFNGSDKKNMFEVEAVSELKDTIILVSPRGLENEVYRETYPTKFEAQQRINSFENTDGWAKFENAIDNIKITGEQA
jgi:hypothetical protein